MPAIITHQNQARKLAMNIASEILKNQILTLPVEKQVHPSCCPLVYKELHKIADGLKNRAKNIEVDNLEEID